jgi:Tfp pilus assembly protein PilX
MTISARRPRLRPRSEDGLTMVIVLGVMLVTSMLMVAAFAGANGDIHLSHRDTIEKQAYYAALAGVQEYEYKLEANPNYWQTCEEPAATVPAASPQEADQRYEVGILTASSAPESFKACSVASPFESVIESKGPLANTFRIESVGCAGLTELKSCVGQPLSKVATRKLVATFQVTGFLDYVYFTQYEDQDPEAYASGNKEDKEACTNYRAQREVEEAAKPKAECHEIEFAEKDNVKGPMHTNDSANVCGEVEFGRPGHSPPDLVEIDKGTNTSGCGGGGSHPVYNTASGNYEKGQDLIPPESDSSLAAYVEAGNEFEGLTELELLGTTIKVTTFNEKKEKLIKTIEWPKNGLIFIRSKVCEYNNFDQQNTDTNATYKEEYNCGSVYVHGTYTRSLTIGAETDLIINGNVSPSGVALGNAPSGTVVLGLIATRYVRVYHPCEGNNNLEGTMKEPWIYAAILSTAHSFVNDNYQCGSKLNLLNVYGAIAQKFRGIVGRVGSSGYTKDYKYDERLATEEPPYYLSPLKAGWKIVRETAP